MRKRMLITGGSGFFGRNFTEFYKDKYTVKAIGREDLDKVFSDFTPNVIIHCASEIYDNDKMFESNVVYTKKILDYCRTFNVDKLILFGSSSEYGRKDHAIAESDFLEPQTLYESTKGAASLLAQSYAYTYGINITLIRPFTIMGKFEKPHKFLPTLYKKYKNKETLKLADGNHDIVFIDDFVRAVDTILNYREINSFNIVNVGSGSQTSNQELVNSFEAVLGYKYDIENVDKLRLFDTDVWYCYNKVLREKYGVDFLAEFASGDPSEACIKNTKEEYLKSGIAKFIENCERLNLYND